MQKFIPEIIINHLKKNGIDYIKSLPDQKYATYSDVVQYCVEKCAEKGEPAVDFAKLVMDAVSLGYDERYHDTTEIQDERIAIKDEFCTSFGQILEELSIYSRISNLKVVVVGIGDGLEGEMLYNRIDDLTIVDIAPNSLNNAKSQLPYATSHMTGAENLEFASDSQFDVYISLRTYQSTFFDIFGSLKEAKRVLKHDGAIVVSVASGYLDANNGFIHGLYNPFTKVFEKDRPDIFLNYIEYCLIALGFAIIGIKRILTEIFIYAHKNE